MCHGNKAPKPSFSLLALNWPQQMSSAVVSDLRFYKHTGTVCRHSTRAPQSSWGEAAKPTLAFPKLRTAMNPPHQAPSAQESPWGGSLPEICAFPLAFLRGERQQIKSTDGQICGQELSSETTESRSGTVLFRQRGL